MNTARWKPSDEQFEIIKSIIADYQEYDGLDNSVYTDIKRKLDLLRELIKF